MLLLLGLLLLTLAAGAAPLPADCQQVVLVRSRDWRAASGELRCYERDRGQPWRGRGPAVPVQLGRNGLGWGRGLHPVPPAGDPVKVEGDGRAPAGVFRISLMFGSDPPPTASFPYLALTPTLLGIDDPNSRHYNEIVDRERVAVDWRSAERMLIPDYRLGLRVDHNRPHAVPGLGSCIFMHLWETPQTPTSGCTVMDYPSLLGLCRWMQDSAQAVLVQLPQGRYQERRGPWGLP